jgi:hypothetical protein
MRPAVSRKIWTSAKLGIATRNGTQFFCARQTLHPSMCSFPKLFKLCNEIGLPATMFSDHSYRRALNKALVR